MIKSQYFVPKSIKNIISAFTFFKKFDINFKKKGGKNDEQQN